MKLRVEPIYGWGWSDCASGQSIDVPPPFEFEVSIVKEGEPFRGALGHLLADRHVLSGMWILLTQRHVVNDGFYNLTAFEEQPRLAVDLASKSETPFRITGFAAARLEDKPRA